MNGGFLLYMPGCNHSSWKTILLFHLSKDKALILLKWKSPSRSYGSYIDTPFLIYWSLIIQEYKDIPVGSEECPTWTSILSPSVAWVDATPPLPHFPGISFEEGYYKVHPCLFIQYLCMDLLSMNLNLPPHPLLTINFRSPRSAFFCALKQTLNSFINTLQLKHCRIWEIIALCSFYPWPSWFYEHWSYQPSALLSPVFSALSLPYKVTALFH